MGDESPRVREVGWEMLGFEVLSWLVGNREGRSQPMREDSDERIG